MATLWQLTQDELSFIALMEENGGEVNDEIIEELAIRRENFQTKAEAYAKFILKLESESEQAAAEIKRIQSLKKAKDNTVTRLKESLLAALMVFTEEDAKGIRRYETPLAKLSTRRSQAVEVLDEKELPDAAFVIKKEVSKTQIKVLIEQGIDCPGAQIKENLSLSIR
jgi:hypothetical protein